jgi:hypothetical protein
MNDADDNPVQSDELEIERDELGFDCIRGMLYHEDREQFYARRSKWILFLVTVLGAGAFSKASLSVGLQPEWSGLLVAILGAANLSFDWPEKARLHSKLKQDTASMLADLSLPTCDVAAVRARIDRSSGEEPPTMHAVNALAYINACQSRGKINTQMKIDRCQRFTRHWFAYSPSDFALDKAGSKG